MASCPFCNGTIDEARALHGGLCPHCLVDIPGEETATDPGVALAAEIQAEDEAKARKRATAPLMWVAPIVLAVVAGTAWQLWPEPEVEALTFGEEDFAFEIDLAAWEPPAEDAASDAPAPTTQARRPKADGAATADPAPAGTLQDRLAAANTPAAETRRARSGSADAPSGGVRTLDAPTASGSADAAASLDLNFDTRRKAALLTSRDDIQSAVSDMLRARVPRLQQCFERHLKNNADLRGQWRLAFTIGTDGKASDVSASGQQMSDGAFEACIEREMGGWRIYGRLAKAWPVSLPVTFNPGG